jgi:hypothetical protein
VSSLLVEAGPAAAAQLVAQIAVPVQNPEPPPGQGEEFGKASPIALVVILALAVITLLLGRSMSKRLRRLPGSFETSADQPAERSAAPASPEPARQQEKTGGDAAESGGS